MKKKTLLSIGALLGMFILCISSASAQITCCPNYTVNVTTTAPPACYPLTVTTTWTGGAVGNSVHTGPGIKTVPATLPPGCWRPPLLSITVNGINIPLPAMPCPGMVTFIGCGNVRVCTTMSGCLTITVS